MPYADHVSRIGMFASIKTVRTTRSIRFIGIGWHAQGCRSSYVETIARAFDTVGVDGCGNEESKVRKCVLIEHDLYHTN